MPGSLKKNRHVAVVVEHEAIYQSDEKDIDGRS
jgi:hypothetical protein